MTTASREYPFVLLILVLVFSQSLSSCSQNSNPSGVSSGTLTGVVTLGKENRSSPQAFPSSVGVAVTLDNSSFSTTTDSSGFWKFDNVPSGNYDITISKAGFGLTRIYGVTVQGPGSAYIPHITLGEAPTGFPQLVSARITDVRTTIDSQQVDRKDLQVRWNSPLARDNNGLWIFLDSDSLVQPADVHLYSSVSNPQWWEGSSNSNDGFLACPISALHAAGIPSGSTVYISLAQYDLYGINGAAPNNRAVYYDPVHNQDRIISPSPRSNVMAVTIP